MLNPNDWVAKSAVPYFEAISMPRPLIGIFSLICAIYFYFGFIESARIALLKNSQAVAGGHLKETVGKTLEIETALDQWIESKEARLQYFEDYTPKVLEYANALEIAANEDLKVAANRNSNVANVGAKLEQFLQLDHRTNTIFIKSNPEVVGLIKSIYEYAANFYDHAKSFQSVLKDRVPSVSPPEAARASKDTELEEALALLKQLVLAVQTIDAGFEKKNATFFQSYEIRTAKIYFYVTVIAAFFAVIASLNSLGAFVHLIQLVST